MSYSTTPGRRSTIACWLLLMGLAWSQAFGAVEPGSAAPDLALPLISPVSESSASYPLLNLSDFRGKVVYLDFWDTSCGPCRESLPQLSTLREQFVTSGVADVEIFSVNLDTDPNRALTFLSRYPVEFPVVSDPSSASAQMYDLTSLPTAFYISRDGTIVDVHRGFTRADITTIAQKLATLIAVR